ncbi:MAG: FtsW/RodA/SpoVE family cell cycle protein [Bacteroidia bacterium]
MTWIDSYFKGDRVIWLIVFILSIFSLLAVYSSTGTLAYRYQSGNTEYYMFKHFVILLLGLAIMYGAHLVKYTFYAKLSRIALVIVIPLLILTLVSGTNLNEASRWLTLPGIGLSFQTSDFAKLGLLLYVSRMLSLKQDNIKDFKSAFVPIMLPVLVVCGLILPANFSTAAVLFACSLCLMFIGRINFKYIAGLVGIGVVCFGLFIGIAKLTGYTGRIDTWMHRIENFKSGDSDGNYQTEQAKIAIATGGALGKGPGNSTQRNFLPHPYSDMIFAIICEEYGLWGAFVVIGLYVLLLYRTVVLIKQSPKAFATLFAAGCSFGLVFQAMINMAVATNLFPVTGQPLPMLSMGGTSIWFTSLSLGILLSVSRDIVKEENEQPAAA